MSNLQVAKCEEVDETDEFDYSSDPLQFGTPKSTLTASLTRIPRDFTITADSYISLCSHVYDVWCSTDPTFGRAIPESPFQYYAIMVLWRRFADIIPSSCLIESTFLTQLKSFDLYYKGLSLATYIKGIGHLRDPDGCDRRFRLPAIPTNEKIAGIPYTFGKVDAETHFLYEAFPAPGIAVLRMLADIKYTLNTHEENLLWDLPEGLRPDIQESHVKSVKPTKNLLGWAPAQRLNDQQLKLLQSPQIEEKFSSHIISTEIFNELLSPITDLVHTAILSDTKIFKFQDVRLWCLPLFGSVAQGATIEKHNEVSKFTRSAMYCEGMLSVSSPYNLNDALYKGAVISGYRMMTEAIGGRHCWSCYDFDEYRHVPESWIRSRNTIYNYGDVRGLNETIYSTGYVSKRHLQNEYVQYSVCSSPQEWNTLM